MNLNTLKIIYSASEIDSDLYYATGFLAPDPFLFIELNGKKIIFLSDLEYERGKNEAKVDVVERTTTFTEALKKIKPTSSMVDILLLWLEKNEVKKESIKVELPYNFPAYLFKEIFSQFPLVEVKKNFLYIEDRMKKKAEELQNIKEILKITAGAFDIVKYYLENSQIRGEFLYYNGEKLTSEFLKKKLNEYFISNDAFATSLIIACGKQGCEPHNPCTGPVYAYQTLVVDIYPRSLKTRYWGDMTRTFVRGSVSSAVERMYEAVIKAQQMCIERIREDVDGEILHTEVVKFFEENGYKTGIQDGRLQGFIHSTGHGLGLDIHEPPRIGPGGGILKEGHVVTVEPGLYYFDIGAVRIEDVVLVKKEGVDILSSYPKILKI